MLSFFPRDVLDVILYLIESVSEGFPTYSYRKGYLCKGNILLLVKRRRKKAIGYTSCTQFHRLTAKDSGCPNLDLIALMYRVELSSNTASPFALFV